LAINARARQIVSFLTRDIKGQNMGLKRNNMANSLILFNIEKREAKKKLSEF
jgi:hypothetical protein